MGGGRRYFMRFDQRDPEHGSNAHYGRRDGRDLIQVEYSWCFRLTIIEYSHYTSLCFTLCAYGKLILTLKKKFSSFQFISCSKSNIKGKEL